MKTPIQSIKHKNLTQKARYAYYYSLSNTEQQEIQNHYNSIKDPSNKDKSVIAAINKVYEIFMSNGKLSTDIYLNIQKHLKIDLKITSKPAREYQDYFSEDLQDILHYDKAIEFINALPYEIDPTSIQFINDVVVMMRNETVIKLQSVVTKDKDITTSNQRDKYNKAIKLIQEIQRDETNTVDEIRSYDDVIVNNRKIIAGDVRVNFERSVAKAFTTILIEQFGYRLQYIPNIGDLAVMYAELFFIELQRKDTTPVSGEN